MRIRNQALDPHLLSRTLQEAGRDGVRVEGLEGAFLRPFLLLQTRQARWSSSKLMEAYTNAQGCVHGS
jgi:hypothetical protein